jgi:hypothetical protein
MRDPMLADEIVDILMPHARGCQDVDSEMCDTAIGQAGEIAAAFRAALLDDATVEEMGRATWAEWDSLAEDVRCRVRNHLIRHLTITADVLVPVPVAAAAAAEAS